MSTPDKLKLHALCIETLHNKLSELKRAITNVQDSIETEEGSTAGDKYQTSRAMDQIELERLQKQEADLKKMLQVLNRLNNSSPSPTVQLGSLVQLNGMFCYLSAPLGLVKYGDSEIRVISPVSPLGRLMIGKKKGEDFDFQGNSFQITDII